MNMKFACLPRECDTPQENCFNCIAKIYSFCLEPRLYSTVTAPDLGG